jgi:hypothetical protein
VDADRQKEGIVKVKLLCGISAVSVLLATTLVLASPVGATSGSMSGCTAKRANGEFCEFTAASGTIVYKAVDPKGANWQISDVTQNQSVVAAGTTSGSGTACCFPVTAGDTISIFVNGSGNVTASS